jgi:hypothetical protein
MLENLKREAPEQLVQAANTVALEAARWAQQAIIRDKKIYAEVQALKNILVQFTKMSPGAAVDTAEVAEAPAASANGTNGTHAHAGVDPSTLKGEDLERYMDAVLANEPPNPNAPAPPKPFGATAQSAETAPASEVVGEDAAVARPEGVVVVPAAAAKAKARAAQVNGPAAPKA